MLTCRENESESSHLLADVSQRRDQGIRWKPPARYQFESSVLCGFCASKVNVKANIPLCSNDLLSN